MTSGKMQICSAEEVGKTYSPVVRFIGYTEQCVIPFKMFPLDFGRLQKSKAVFTAVTGLPSWVTAVTHTEVHKKQFDAVIQFTQNPRPGWMVCIE